MGCKNVGYVQEKDNRQDGRLGSWDLGILGLWTTQDTFLISKPGLPATYLPRRYVSFAQVRLDGLYGLDN